MERKQILVGPHGGHNRLYGDDGLADPWEMVQAAWTCGIVPAQTSHNTMRAIPPYLEAMDHYFGYKLALPGVELSFRITNFDPVVTADPTADDNLRYFFPPSVMRFVQNRHSGQERSLYLTPSEIREAQEKIRTCFESFYNKPLDEIRTMFKIGRHQYLLDMLSVWANYERIQFDLLRENPQTNITSEDVLDIIIGQRVAITEPGFPAFLAVTEKLIAEEFKAEKSPLETVSEALKISYLGLFYYQLNKTRRLPLSKAKGEIIALMPPERPLIEKVTNIVEYWRENKFHLHASLNDLFNLFKDRLTADEYKALVWYLPHPTSIDVSWLGRAILRLYEKEVDSLFSPEIFIPEVAEEIDVIETYNASHPPISNKASGNIASIDLLKTKARAGASDSHHPVWVGAGATLIAADELTAYGILEAFRRGDTLPISGLGRNSLSWKAFFYWLATVPVAGKDLVPEAIRKEFIGSRVDIQTPAKQAIENGIIYQRGNKPNWIY